MRHRNTVTTDAPMPEGHPGIGGTPLRPIRIPLSDRVVRLWLKLESANPYGSIKARTADALLARLEADGELRAGMRVVESTSGNLGVALAGLCAARGYRCTLVVERSTPAASIDRMTAYGADVVVVPDVPGGRTLAARLGAVRDLLDRDPAAVWTNQYESPANPGVHEHRTAVELAEAAPPGGFDAVAVAVSTGGTLAGIARYFRANQPRTAIVAVDAVGSAALGGSPAERPHKLPGFGSAQVSAFVTAGHWDQAVRVRDTDALDACAVLGRRTGVSLGGSAGAAVLAATVVALRDRSVRHIACICPDSGEKYAGLRDGPQPAEQPDEPFAAALRVLGRAEEGIA